jgi:dolichol-phosphate mannosyltransferase
MLHEAILTTHNLDMAYGGVDISIIIPTFNETDNIDPLIAGVEACLSGIHWEMIVVDDDSTDGTADRIRAIAQTNPRIRLIHRIGRRGLASACVEGILSSSAPYVAVMDADLQHDEKLLPKMYSELQKNDFDIVVGSRYTSGGTLGDWQKSRAFLSRLATGLSRRILKANITDPMSGFFMMKHRAAVQCIRGGATGMGYKILFDFFASSPEPLQALELPYRFRRRTAGESKLDSMVAWEFILLLLDKTIGKYIPIRFLAFAAVGAIGVGVHLTVLSITFKTLALPFWHSQAIATFIAMTSNFLLNNILTYRDLRLRGWKLIRGWLSFTAVCGIGAVANVGVAGFLYEKKVFWMASAIAGILVGTVWNYAVTKHLTWRSKT